MLRSPSVTPVRLFLSNFEKQQCELTLGVWLWESVMNISIASERERKISLESNTHLVTGKL